MQPSATPARSAAPFSAPADVPTTRSKESVSPARSSAAAIAQETMPRIAPPSTTSATRAPSSRASGLLPAARRASSSSRTGCLDAMPLTRPDDRSKRQASVSKNSRSRAASRLGIASSLASRVKCSVSMCA